MGIDRSPLAPAKTEAPLPDSELKVPVVSAEETKVEVCSPGEQQCPDVFKQHKPGIIKVNMNDSEVAACLAAVEANPTEAKLYQNLALRLRRNCDFEGAAAAYRATLQLDPRHVKARCSLGLVLERQGDVDGAVKAYQDAIEVDPGYAKAHCNLGAVLGSQGDLDGAVAALNCALEADPGLWEARYILGVIMEGKQLKRADP